MPDNRTGKLIQELRIKAGFSQKTLAAALHITDKAISMWERGICLPDISLLPKLSLLLDTDLELIISHSIEQEEWVGLIDIRDTDFSQIVYDKPLVYYLLCHFILVGITKIHVLTNKKNKEYLKRVNSFGIDFIFTEPRGQNMMILDHPWFLFGSDLTQQFQGAMLSQRMVKLVPQNQKPVFYYVTSKDSDLYFKDKKRFKRSASERTLGRGMICFDMDDYDKILDVADFVRTYQSNSGLLIGDIEEVAYRRGLISEEQLMAISELVPYGKKLKAVLGVNHKSVYPELLLE